MSARNLSKSRLFLQYAVAALGLFAANTVFAADAKEVVQIQDCECGDGIQSTDISKFVKKMSGVESNRADLAVLTPAMLGAKPGKDANSFIWFVRKNKETGKYYTLMGSDKGAFGSLGGRLTVDSNETFVAAAVRELREETAAGIAISEQALLENAVTFVTMNHRSLAEVIFMVELEDDSGELDMLLSDESMKMNFARIAQNRGANVCRKVDETTKKGKAKRCAYEEITNLTWVSINSMVRNFLRQGDVGQEDASFQFPYISQEIQGGYMKSVKVPVDVDGKGVVDLMVDRDKIPSHLRNLFFAQFNKNLGDGAQTAQIRQEAVRGLELIMGLSK